jgi:adenylylsulfate kinase-like enzyme
VSPFRADRAMVRALHDDWNLPFIEVFIDVPLEVAESRDPKGLYKKARAGEIRDFTGIHQPYEAPERAEMVLDSSRLAVEASAELVIAELRARKIID